MTSSEAPNTGSEYLNALGEMTEKMTEQALSTINRSQQAVLEAVANWAQSTQGLMPQRPTPEALRALPQPTELVDRSFEIAEQLLQAQHTFAMKLMESVRGPMTEAATKAASAAQDLSNAAAASTEASASGAAEASDSLSQTVRNAFRSDASAS